MGVSALSLHRVYRLSDMILQTKLRKLRLGPTKSYIYTPQWVLTDSHEGCVSGHSVGFLDHYMVAWTCVWTCSTQLEEPL